MKVHSVSIAFQTDKPITTYGELGKTVEDHGFDIVSVYNDLFFQPAWPCLFEIARNTRRIHLGPAAVNPFLTHPISIAGQIALLDELSQGRAYLGLARGAWLDRLKIAPDQPITAMKEAFGIIHHLLSQAETPFHGSVFSLTSGDSLRWPIRRADIPFLLGSWGEKTIQACINTIAEVKIGGTANPAVVPYMRAIISGARSEDEQDPSNTGIVVGAVTVVDSDGQAARDRARQEVCLYLPVVARLDPTLNLDLEWLAQLQSAVDGHHHDRAAALISDEMLSKFAFAGTPEDVARQAAGLFAAGADRVEFGTPHGLTTAEGVNLLGTQVLPALRAIMA